MRGDRFGNSAETEGSVELLRTAQTAILIAVDTGGPCPGRMMWHQNSF